MTQQIGKIRVLWLIKGLGPGGAETLLVSAARVADLSRFSYEVAYVLPWKNKLVGRLEEMGVRTRCLGRKAGDPGWPMALRRLLLQTPGFDIVHLHSPLVAGVARLVVLTIPAGQRPAVVSTEHNTWGSFALPTRLLNAMLSWKDARRFAVSAQVRQSVWRIERRGVEVLVHGIVLQDADQALSHRAGVRRSLGLEAEDVVVGTVANYRAQKGYPDLLSAAAQVLAEVPKARFLAVGQGPLEGEIVSQHAQLELGDRFLLLGYRSDVMDVLSACDVFALASLHEGFPIAVMEALAMGVPVVATSVGGVPDAVTPGVHGLIVPPGHPDELARALVRMTSDDDFRAACAAAALASGHDYDIGKAVKRLEQVYAGLAGSRLRRRRSVRRSRKPLVDPSLAVDPTRTHQPHHRHGDDPQVESQ